MDRPDDAHSPFEEDLRRLVPAAPSAALRERISAARALTVTERARPGGPAAPTAGGLRWLGERLAWAAGGALAASLVVAAWSGGREAAAPVAGVATPVAASVPATSPPPAVAVAEEAVTWADEGVQFLDDRTPARILRRLAVERHVPAAGGAGYRVPREDLILLPVALQ